MDEAIVRRQPFGSNPTVGERGTDTRRRVLDAALEVFGEMAYSEARVEQITEKAGCSRPAFYQYFSSKDDVFWALATELGAEMVALAKQLGTVAPDKAGLVHLTEWIDSFMALHEAWAPVFASFPAASRSDQSKVTSSGTISDSTGRSLLRAFGVERTSANERMVTNLVAVLIRCSFYAEHAPAGVSRTPMVVGVAHLFHRVLAGPIDGVNLVHGRPSKRPRIKVVAPAQPTPSAPLKARGEATRRKLLDAGAVVLPARGYHDARVDDIVSAVGVSHGTFYRYFDGKDDFFRVLAEEASTRLIGLVDRLDLDAEPDALRAWLGDWFDAYEADGGVISTWQDMRTSPELRAFSQQVGASVFTRLEKLLDRRDFGEPQVDAAMLMALLERAPYSVFALGFSTRDEAIGATATVLRRGFLGMADGPPLMDFEFTDEQLELRAVARSVLVSACPSSVVRSIYDGNGDGAALWQELQDLDWPGLGIAPAHGGVGLGRVEVGVIVEELGRAVAPTPYLATMTQFEPVLRAAGSTFRLDELASGQVTGTLALAEGGRWSLDAVRATAQSIDGGWVLSGTKSHVLDGATVDEIAVVARSDEGIGVFLVPGSSVPAEPLRVIDPTMPLATVSLDEVEVPGDRVLVAPGDPSADAVVERALQEATTALSLSTVATCRAIFEATVQYAKDREQFGRPIGSFQAVKHRLADCYLAVERAAALAYFAALTIAEDDDRRAVATAMAKAAAGDCQRLLTRDGLQLHGGIGFTWEHDLHFLLKRAVTGELLFGTAAFHRAHLAVLLGLEPAA